MFLERAQEVPPGGVLGHEEDVATVFEDFEQRNDERVTGQRLHHFDFALDLELEPRVVEGRFG